MCIHNNDEESETSYSVNFSIYKKSDQPKSRGMALMFSLQTPLNKFHRMYSVSRKSSPPKTFCNIFTQVKYVFVKFCQYVARLYLHKLTNSGRFILIFNKMSLIFLGVPIIFNVFIFKFHQVKSP